MTLDAGESEEIVISPNSYVSSAPNDVHIIAYIGTNSVASEDMTVVRIVLPAHIRASDTPAAMTADRIPPRVTTSFPVTVTPNLNGSGQSVSLATVTSSGTESQSLTLTHSGTFTLTPTPGHQTAPGHAGDLRVKGFVNGTSVVATPGFSIAAIPVYATISYFAPISTADQLGMTVLNQWQSDSGDLADLDQVRMSEAIQDMSATGTFAGATSSVNDYNDGLMGSDGGSLDNHGTGRFRLTGIGDMVSYQVLIFWDLRTGSKDMSVSNSGYIITREIRQATDGSGAWELTTSKYGASVTANGISSNAGAGGPVVSPKQRNP